jgi:Fe(3+) dicitrate transport protein
MKKFISIVILSFFVTLTNVYSQTDSIKKINLTEIEINGDQSLGGVERMPQMKDNVIYAGKKSEVLILDKINADLSTNNARQVFSKVPGMSVWENDGSGIQVGVAARGLSPNRSWEFNVRQNGYDICSEIFGYPETYYTPPMEALSRIEVVRGAASLQYGPQFGGLINYQIKKGNSDKPIAVETQQTFGSYGLFNTYNAIGGTHKKFNYYGFFHTRMADGWRENSKYFTYTGYFSANYQLTKKINIGAEYTNMNYESQQPGGLTDDQFTQNHKQSLRKRNWFSAPWNVASLLIKYAISSNVNLQIKSFLTLAERNSVGFTKSISIKDTLNTTILNYNPRQVDRDYYKNYGAEARLSVKYKLLGVENIFAGGVRAYSGNTKRNQLGTGTSGDDFDLTLTKSEYGKSLEFGTLNYAVFAENIFQVGKRLKVIPGLRLDYVENTAKGYISSTQAGILNSSKKTRQILLYGIGTELMITDKINVYGNYSQAYRPVTFSELTPSATTEIIDPNMQDAKGFNADFGFKGTVKKALNFDIGLFYLKYENRIGLITQNGAPFKTNIGSSESKGIESFVEVDFIKLFTDFTKYGTISIYSSNSFIDARYVTWNNPTIANDPAKSIVNKRIENAPHYIHRFGASYNLKGFSASFQFSSVGDVFTDATNTEVPNSTATIGKLPAYQVMDATLSYKFAKHYSLKAGVNNITDEKYATRRAGGYPGPGIMPGNGRTFFVSIGGNF